MYLLKITSENNVRELRQRIRHKKREGTKVPPLKKIRMVLPRGDLVDVFINFSE